MEGDFIFFIFYKECYIKWGKKFLEEMIGLKLVEFFCDFGLMMFEWIFKFDL